jgi:hypothetical protein
MEFQNEKEPGVSDRLQREFLLQIKREFPVAVHVRAPDHDVGSMLNNIAALFGVVAVTVI